MYEEFECERDMIVVTIMLAEKNTHQLINKITKRLEWIGHFSTIPLFKPLWLIKTALSEMRSMLKKRHSEDIVVAIMKQF